MKNLLILALALTFIFFGQTRLVMAEPNPSEAIPNPSASDPILLSIFPKLTFYSYEQGLKLLNSTKKIIFVYYFSEKDSNSQKTNLIFLSDQNIINILNESFIFVPIDVEKDKNLAKISANTELPVHFFINSDGITVLNFKGFVQAEMLRAMLLLILNPTFQTPINNKSI
ncbi:MAG: hypothetical protein LBV23_06440 [Deltaproteobacteria bacterium]|jgi:hypothetical protein|nr:hypothetical protein [Deltaproteobacteria bacterium]